LDQRLPARIEKSPPGTILTENGAFWVNSRRGLSTIASITNNGFQGDGDAVVRQAVDATVAFTLVLAGLKALREHDVELNLEVDRFPEGISRETCISQH
jgi:hypothetical protein